MYAPRQFREDRRDVLLAAIRDIRFGLVVAGGGDGAMQAAHVPVMVHEDAGGTVLRTHVARANPILGTIGEGAPALCVFQGPHAYVRPGWLPSKTKDGRVVPTWNYVAAQVRGRVRAVTDGGWLRAHVGALSDAMEAGRDAPWGLSDAPEDYVVDHLRGIVGLEIALEAVTGVWKLNQHHPRANRLGIVDGLRAEGDAGGLAVADAMAGAEARSAS